MNMLERAGGSGLPGSTKGYMYENSSEASSDYSTQFPHRAGAKSDGSGKTEASISMSAAQDDLDVVRYHLYIPPPSGISQLGAVRYILTTRNFLALLLNKAPVGPDFFLTLKDLQTRLLIYMPPGTNCTRLLIRYLITKQLHNVSNNPSMALGLLAWCEQPSVRWKEGWRETFVHCSGMFPRLSEYPEIAHVSSVTLDLLESSHIEVLARVRAAEERLLTFKFDDIWQSQKNREHPAWPGFSNFRKFLRQHYEKAYKVWKIRVAQEHCNDTWLTRELIRDLQRDYGALYDFLVNREGSRGALKKSDGNGAPKPESEDDWLMTLLSAFDRANGYTSILYPQPLLPTSVPVAAKDGNGNENKKAFGLFTSRAARAREKRVVQAYADANNAHLLDKSTLKNALVETFRKYEKADVVAEVDPREARKGRWMLLYCTLQVLAGISVDTPHLFFSKDVPYFLNSRLTNTPPWAVGAKLPEGGSTTVVGVFDEASRLYSHCWIVPKTWGDAAGLPKGIMDGAAVDVYDDEDDLDNDISLEGRPSADGARTESANISTDEHHGVWGASNSSSDLLEQYGLHDDEADLENFGDPGFRAPLRRNKSQDLHGASVTALVDSQVPKQPQLLRAATSMTTAPDEQLDIGMSHYAAPAEW